MLRRRVERAALPMHHGLAWLAPVPCQRDRWREPRCRCLTLLRGGDVEGHLVHALAGPPARWAVHGGDPGPDYWLRVWAIRGLLWHWDEQATDATIRALDDEAWRVREMACNVLARNRVDAALGRLVALREDAVRRVRLAAERAVARLVNTGE